VKDYHINIFFSEEDGCYVTDIPHLRFCSSFGDTPEEALAEVKITKQAWLEAAHNHRQTCGAPALTPGDLSGIEVGLMFYRIYELSHSVFLAQVKRPA